jgi:glycosyltransferase involved in cell wall biosynthesis
MLSVVIETNNDEDALARTLASLVSAAVEGVVREVIVCDRGSTDRTHLVAEHAGCPFSPGACRPASAGAQRLAPVPAAGHATGRWLDGRRHRAHE